MIDQLRYTMQKAFMQRPQLVVFREMWAVRLICVFYLIGIPRLSFGVRFPFDTALLMVLSFCIALLYPFQHLLKDAFIERASSENLRTDGRFALLVLLLFVIFWILLML